MYLSVPQPQTSTGVLTIDSLGGDFPMLAGNVVAIGFSGLVCVVLSLIKPQNYDWALMKEIPMIESDENAFIGAVSAHCLCLLCWRVPCCLQSAYSSSKPGLQPGCSRAHTHTHTCKPRLLLSGGVSCHAVDGLC